MSSPTFRRLFIANRGDAAARIARTCDNMGITPVFAVSEADKDVPYVRDRESVLIGAARSAHSYLNAEALIEAARQSRCSALHPGWGFLSENPRFAALCQAHGLRFVGPPASVMALLGSKTPAKRAMAASGLEVIPGSAGILATVEEAREVADRVGYPVLIKAESGGGGRGMRIASQSDQLASAYAEARNEARSAFGDDRVYLERLLEGGRHVEIQIMADQYGHAVHLGERDCSVQRNHQKLIEESPAPTLSSQERQRATSAAVRAAQAVGYVGAGTMEFLLDDAGVLRFMEVNARLQVEHCVTEMRCGLDLVAEQIRVAAGHRLSFSQEDIELRGHAIECRINAEDPSDGFRPTPGELTDWKLPELKKGRVRCDTHVEKGYSVPPYYDSLLCKLITWGSDRADAISQMQQALEELQCEGVATTASMHKTVLASKQFTNGDYAIGTIPGWEG